MHPRIKKAAMALIGLGVWATVGWAETKYVVDRIEITLRSGPSMDNKVLNMIPSGHPVEVLVTEGDWAQVQVSEGQQGWVMERYLSAEVPKSAQFDRLLQKYEALVSQKDTLGTNSAELSKENQRLSTDLEKAQAEITRLTTTYETLKRESADFIGLKTKYDDTLKELAEIRVKSDSADSEISRLANNQLYQGMLYGGGLLALGFIVGLAVKRSKRKSGLY